MPMYKHILTVGGGPHSTFPVDMLRYDAAYPYTEADSYKVQNAGGLNPEPTEVDLVHMSTHKSWYPTVGRWQSFGWKVINVAVFRV